MDSFHKHPQEISGSDFTYAVLTIFKFAAYYSRGCDSRELFIGKKIEGASDFTEHLYRYDVIRLNMQHFLIGARKQNVTDYLEQSVMEELLDKYGNLIRNPDIILADALKRVYAKTGKKFIFFIDEWDCVMRERQESEDLQKQYLDFLRT